jgi:hypothetical protein
MNTLTLKPGDGVRVTARYRMRAYQTGDQGMVLRELATSSSGLRYYLVKTALCG